MSLDASNTSFSPVPLLCNNDTIAEGYCNDLAVCGFCYGGAEARFYSPEYEFFNLVVIGVVLPTIGILGLLGDSISAFIYSRPQMVSSLNVYLCALAISDITIILTAFFLFFLENMRKRSSTASRYFAILAPFMFPIGLTAQSLSVFLTVAAAFDCFVLVAATPRFRAKFCSVNTSIVMLVIILLVAFIYNSPHIFEIYVIDCWSLNWNEPNKDVCPTALRQDEEYMTIYYAYMYTIVMAGGPVFLLIVINTAIVVAMKRQARMNQQSSSESSDIVTLVLVVCLFISCNVLPLTVNFLELLLGIANSYLIDLSNLMVVVNSSCNFLIYYTFGSHFRKTLKQYLHAVCSPGRKLSRVALEPPLARFSRVPIHVPPQERLI